MRSKQLSKELTLEVIVGVFVFMVLLALGFFTIILSKGTSWFQHKEYVEITFNDVMGLSKGDNVMVQGMTVGKVQRLFLTNDCVHVIASLECPVRLRRNYEAVIVPTSVLGGRYLRIYIGTPDKEYIPEGEVLSGTDPTDLIADATRVLRDVRKACEEGNILDNMQVVFQQLREVTTKINSGEGTIGKLVNDKTVYDDLQKTVANLKEVSMRIAEGKGTIGKLMSEDDKFYKDLSGAVSSINNIASRIDRGEGAIGKLVKDDEMYEDTKKTIRDIQTAVNDLRDAAPLITFTSILFGAF